MITALGIIHIQATKSNIMNRTTYHHVKTFWLFKITLDKVCCTDVETIMKRFGSFQRNSILNLQYQFLFYESYNMCVIIDCSGR